MTKSRRSCSGQDGYLNSLQANLLDRACRSSGQRSFLQGLKAFIPGNIRDHSYFKTMPSRSAAQRQEASGDLFEVSVAPGPEGFRYAPELFSPAEEKAFVAQFEDLPFKPFEFHGYQGNRRIVSYGYRYDYAGRTLRTSEAMPIFLQPLREIASQLSGISVDALEQALVTEYAPGAGIGWHRDKPMFEDVVALSFLAPCVLRLRRNDGVGWQRQAVAIAPRSGYVLHGAARSEWEHSIVPMAVLRYSVTFRSFRPDYIGPS
jgi:alkylated DNA repair dioxygenase AlkB